MSRALRGSGWWVALLVIGLVVGLYLVAESSSVDKITRTPGDSMSGERPDSAGEQAADALAAETPSVASVFLNLLGRLSSAAKGQR